LGGEEVEGDGEHAVDACREELGGGVGFGGGIEEALGTGIESGGETR
jgi:hypothetical protein